MILIDRCYAYTWIANSTPLLQWVTDLSWKSSLIYLFIVYSDESRSYYGNKSQPENI